MQHLSVVQIDQFILDGFIRIENAFPTELAEQCRGILWKATGFDPHDTSTWTQPVMRIGEFAADPFIKAANTPVLHNAFDQLAGKDNWIPRESVGTFVIRFPNKIAAGDTGWHVDASFPGEEANDYFNWRINVNSKGRALLMLFLFSDVEENDAPTRIKRNSHLQVAKILEPAGEKGLSFTELAQRVEDLPECDEVLATGKAGTVYLCHPFLVHAAQDHHGSSPKFMAQPPLVTSKDFNIYQRKDALCPVEKAILKGIHDEQPF
jgi:hypothetical protein